MADTMNTGILFLINTLFNLCTYLLIIRLLLVWVGANYLEQFTQMIVSLTDFAVKPTRRFIPNIQRIETSSLVLILLLNVIKFMIVCLISFGFPNLFGVLIASVGDLIKGILEIMFYAIILQVILSWIQPEAPINRLLMLITSPIMQPVRRFTPLINGIDISPIPALIILQLLVIIIANPIILFGISLAAV